MRVDFLGLQAFLAIAERGSFQRAAAHLNLSQTALSHRMKKLEDDLGVRLLSRTTRQVSLTQAGLDLLPRARRALDDIAAGLDALRRQAAGRAEPLAIGCLPTLAMHHLPPILTAFARRHPGVSVRVFDNSATEIAELVESGTAEFGLTILTAGRWDLDAEMLLKEPFVLLCPNDHPIGRLEAASWADIANEPLIRVSAQTGNRLIIDDTLGARRENVTWRYEVQHVATAVSLVAAGAGLAVLPRLAVEPDNARGLAVVSLRNPAISRTVGLVTRRGAVLSPLAEELRTLISAQFRERRRRPAEARE